MNASAYSTSQKLLHWVSAVIIVWALLSGFFVAVFSVPASVKAWVAFFNVSLTTVYIPVFVLRVYCSFAHGLDFSVKRTLQEYLALLVHKAMYLVLAVVLATGVLMMDRPINIFNLLSIAPLDHDPARIALYTRVHVLSCVGLLLMLVLHIGAVVMHERRGKRVMARMLFKAPVVQGAVSGGNFASFNATSNAPINSATINAPMPFHPPKCQKNPPAVPAMLEPT
ncbi:cytochrome b561 [Pseudomonas sp. S3E17]|nr:cytochrome b561 [Pseudomonas sp. S3E17]